MAINSSWLRPPRQILVIFLAVAAVSTAVLGWLGWVVLQQDRDLEAQRRRVELERTADSAVAAMQLTLADLKRLSSETDPGRSVPEGLTLVSIHSSGASTVVPAASIPYLPVLAPRVEAPAGTFRAAEDAEFRARDLPRAARLYASLAESRDSPVRAGALGRLARVRRHLGDHDGALRMYDELLSAGESVAVLGYPASLFATLGRLSTLQQAGRTADIRAAAREFSADIARGRWSLLRWEYEAQRTLAAEYGAADGGVISADASARAAALEWVWMNRALLPASVTRVVSTPAGPALAVARADGGTLTVVVSGPSFLDGLCKVTVGYACAIATEGEGRVVIGEAPLNVPTAIRAAALSNLPWTLQIYPTPAAPHVGEPQRRLPLVTFLALMFAVLGAGWYFILRSLSREIRTAKLQADFVAAVSHEFRSPLTSLAHVSEMLAEGRLADDELRRRSYDVLVRDTDRLRRLVETLLDFGHFERGGPVRMERTDMRAFVREVLSEFAQRVESAGYIIDVTTPDDAVFARLDRDAMRRALWNLLDNAVKYSPDSRTVSFTLTARSSVSITVRDEGLGIPPHEQSAIFDKFVRGAESKARHIPGTGVGLALVRQIVGAHGGDVQVTSAPGQGSSFTITLPLAVVDGAAGECTEVSPFVPAREGQSPTRS